jgi:hypothetical protein
VARGYEQQHGINFQETFAPIVRWKSIRLIIAFAAHFSWPIHHMDVVTAFLNGYIQEDIFMQQPPGCVLPGSEHLVCKLNRALYGLKQSQQQWYSRIDTDLRRRGMQRTATDGRSQATGD